MSEPRLISPMLDGFIMGECVSDHNGVRCCPAIHEETGERYIVKIISIPASQVQLDALLLTGACKDTAAAQNYFMELAAGVAGEADILTRLSNLEGYAPYQDTQIVTMDEGIGYEVYLLSPYKRSLERQMRLHPLTHLAAVNLGLDLCAALAVCRRGGHLYVDLKPSNVFITENQEYRIGDLGFIPLESLPYASLPEKYRSSYTAPEIRDAMSTLNDTMDIYALGLVLYQVYNNGELPFEGEAPDVKLPPPAYADYEIAEIILKACSPNVWERWQDPAQMGQALINYMQRNGVNDTPIVPPPVEIPAEEPVEEPEEEFLSEAENEEALAAALEELEETEQTLNESVADLPPLDPDADPEVAVQEDELGFMEELSSDETAPTEESVQELEDTAVTEEVSDMLAQADELIAHELPEPAVAPDPIDVPIPPPIIPEEEEPAEPEEETTEEAEETSNTVDTTNEETAEKENAEEPQSEDEEPEVEYYDPDAKPRRKGLWITLAAVAVLLISLGMGAYYYYHNIYLQTVDSLRLIGTEDSITVFLTADSTTAGKLSVTCTDTYGNSRRSNVVNGTAVFSDLEPGTQYKVQVEISGTHKLLGSTTGSYTTAAQTQITNLTAAIGPEDGSVILNFSVVGPDSEEWSVAYAPVDSPEKILDFTGHNVTVTGLEPGVEHCFRLIPKTDLYLTGSSEIRFTPKKIVYAQNLTITTSGGGKLTAQWALPDGAEAQIWTVRCYNDAGYDETITTEDTSVTFEGLDHTTGYTVKVTAQGMSQSATAAITANPITITGFEQDLSKPYKMTLTWSFTGDAPAAGWLLNYTVNDGEIQTLECAENSVVFDVYPGDLFAFTLQCLDPVTYYPMDYSVEVPGYESFEGFGLTAGDLKFSMCKTPDKENWDRKDLEDSDYKTTFAIGESASFVVKRPKNSEGSEKSVKITYVIRTADGSVVSIEEAKFVWDDLWNKRYCELVLPAMPDAAGDYSIDICFNGKLACTQEFIITAE